MQELKDKLKSIKLFGKSGKFEGTGHRLGDGSSGGSSQAQRPSAPHSRPQQPGRPLGSAPTAAPRAGVPASAPARPAPPAVPAVRSAAQAPVVQQALPQRQQQQTQQQQQQVIPSAAVPAAAPQQQQPPAAQRSSSSSEAAGRPSSSSFNQQQQQQPASDALALAVAQLASDPLGSGGAEVLARLLCNVLANPGEGKYRRVRLSNPRIQSAVVDVHGGVETLLACGFNVIFEEDEGGATEGYAVLAAEADLQPLEQALQLLAPLLPPPAPAPTPTPQHAAAPPAVQAAAPSQGLASTASLASSSAAAAAPAAVQQQPAPANQRPARRPPAEQQWDPPRERCTQVVLPTSIERDVPDWFFARTGAELKAAFLAAVRRREQDQMLMTKAMRERLRSAPDKGAYRCATLRVRFPEGVSLQGEFNPREPVAAVFAWVADALSDPLHTYELITPERRPLDVGAGSVADADLLPAATLNFRWTGASAAEMKETPALRAELLQHAVPAAPLY